MKLLRHILIIAVIFPLSLISQNNICSGSNIEVSTSNYNDDSEYSQNYVLVDNDGNIIDQNSNGVFNSSSYGENYSGNINIYAVNTNDALLMSNANSTTWNSFTTNINNTCAQFIGPVSFNIITNDTTEETYTSCNNFLWSTNNQTYSSSGTYYFETTNINGCDSVIQLNLTISNSSTNSTESVCDSIIWNGNTYNSSGIYTQSNGTCNDSLFLTINNSYQSSSSQTACNSYLWSANSVSYTTSGFYTLELTNANGCDSTLSLDLSIVDCNVTPQCSGDTLKQIANGFNPNYSQLYVLADSISGDIISYNTSGSFTPENYDYTILRTLSLYAINTNDAQLVQFISNATNWDAIFNYSTDKCADIIGAKYFEIIPCCDLSVIPLITNETCQNENDGQLNLTISGNSTYDITLGSNPISENTIPGNYDYFNLSPNNYQIEVVDTYYLNCDTTFNFNISPGNETYNTDVNPVLCYGERILINGTFYDGNNPSGTETLLSTNGCDSILEINVTENLEIRTGINNSICYGDSIEINGKYYSANNLTGLDTLTAQNGCDSILDINILEDNQIRTPINLSYCYQDSIFFNGNYYSNSNVSGIDTLIASNGCDSILDISASQIDQIINDMDIQVCFGGSVLINDIIYDVNNPTGIDTLTASSGCDSILDISVVEVENIINILNETVCYGDSIEINSNYYSVSNPNGSDTLTASIGCDSIVVIDIVELSQITGTHIDSVCNGDSILINSNYYSMSNPSGSETLVASNGCDSIISVTISEKVISYSAYTDSVCFGDSILINSNYYSLSSPNGTDTLTASNGCDSIVTINIIEKESIITNISDSVCFGYSIEINNQTYNANNLTGSDTLQAINGCDSIINISIYEIQPITATIDSMLCHGDTLVINGVPYFSGNPTGTQTLFSNTGCDTTLTITVTELDEINYSLNDTLCYGDSLIINGIIYNADNNSGTEILMSENGCDSTLNISLFEHLEINSSVLETICKNDTFEFNNNFYYYGNSEGEEIYIAENGCDSIVNVELIFDSLPNITANLIVNSDTNYNLIDNLEDTVCDFDTLLFYGLGGSSYIWSNNIVNDSIITSPLDQYYNVLGVDSNGCTNIFEFELFIDEYCIDFNIDTSNVFTPDGDGINDIFTMSGESFETKTLQIYNRWGQLIFENFDGKGWDGRLQSGMEAEEATYFFMTTIQPITRQQSEILSIQGYLKLIRAK